MMMMMMMIIIVIIIIMKVIANCKSNRKKSNGCLHLAVLLVFVRQHVLCLQMHCLDNWSKTTFFDNSLKGFSKPSGT